MSKQEETPTYALPYEGGPKKPYFDKEYIESKIKAFSEVHKGETAEQIEAECRGEEVPIEVCGKKVVVSYARTQEEACASCAFCSRKECHDLDCNMRDIIGESVCRYAYFVDAEQQETDLDAEIFAWQKAHATEETKQIIAMTARHFAEWGAEHLKK